MREDECVRRKPCFGLVFHFLLFLQDLVATEHPEKASTEVICQVHQHDVSCITLNHSGGKIATASSKVKKTPSYIHGMISYCFILSVSSILYRVLSFECTAHRLDNCWLSFVEELILPTSTGEKHA